MFGFGMSGLHVTLRSSQSEATNYVNICCRSFLTMMTRSQVRCIHAQEEMNDMPCIISLKMKSITMKFSDCKNTGSGKVQPFCSPNCSVYTKKITIKFVQLQSFLMRTCISCEHACVPFSFRKFQGNARTHSYQLRSLLLTGIVCSHNCYFATADIKFLDKCIQNKKIILIKMKDI